MVKHCAKNDTFQLFSFHLFYFASIYNVLSQKYADEQAIEPIQAIQLRKIWLISLIKHLHPSWFSTGVWSTNVLISFGW